MRAYWGCERVLTPGLRFSQAHYEDALNERVTPGSTWLDIGCGHQILPAWRRAAEDQLVARAGNVIGVDPDLASLNRHETIRHRVLASTSDLPFPDGHFDLVTANMVVEHLDQPEQQFAEIARVLRPGGVFMFHTPNANAHTTVLARIIPESAKKLFVRILENRRAEDLFVTHYRANTPDALRRIAASSGFQLREIRYTTTTAGFAILLPLAIIELLYIRLLMTQRFERLRQTLIVFFQKPTKSQTALPQSH